MKNYITNILLVAVITAVMLVSCQPADFKEIGSTREVAASLAGNWTLTKVTQKDEDAARKGFPYSELDLTTVFPYTEFKLTLNVNGPSPSTFTAAPGNSPKILSLTSGTWGVDNGDAPGAIIFKGAGGSTEQVTLGAYPLGGNDKLRFKIERRDADPAANNKLLLSYTYEFSKQ